MFSRMPTLASRALAALTARQKFEIAVDYLLADAYGDTPTMERPGELALLIGIEAAVKERFSDEDA